MSVSIQQLSVPVFAKTLGNLSAILDKAAAHAEAKKIDPTVLLGARLFPDMFPLMRQIQLAGDFAKGSVARLAGHDATEARRILGARVPDMVVTDDLETAMRALGRAA